MNKVNETEYLDSTKKFILDIALRISNYGLISGVDALAITRTILDSGIVELRNTMANLVHEKKESIEIIKFYSHSWDNGEKAINFLEKQGIY